MFNFGVKDIIDIFLFALLLYYVYRLMKESGTINIFYGVLSFIVVWVLCSEIFEMRLIGTILDKFMAIGLIILGVMSGVNFFATTTTVATTGRCRGLCRLCMPA